MKTLAQTQVDPAQIFSQAHRFNQAYKALTSHEALTASGVEALGPPAAVVSALSCELFFKCLICIETGNVPRGHHLKHFYDSLTPTVRNRVTEIWNATVVRVRQAQWAAFDPKLRPPERLLAMDLPSALVDGNQTFEKIRYVYEGGLQGQAFCLSDLPLVLSLVAIELKPELEALHPRNQK